MNFIIPRTLLKMIIFLVMVTRAQAGLHELFADLVPCQTRQDFLHRLFLITNEDNTDRTLNIMDTHQSSGNTFIGVSGFASLDMVAEKAVSKTGTGEALRNVIILDRSAVVAEFWKGMEKIILRNLRREEALTELAAYMMTNAPLFQQRSSPTEAKQSTQRHLLRLSMAIKNQGSWLSSDEKYAAIREIFLAGNFAFLPVDLENQGQLGQLAQILKRENKSVGYLYLSNVAEYAFASGNLDQYKQALQELGSALNDQTLIIDTIKQGSVPAQVTLLKADHPYFKSNSKQKQAPNQAE